MMETGSVLVYGASFRLTLVLIRQRNKTDKSPVLSVRQGESDVSQKKGKLISFTVGATVGISSGAREWWRASALCWACLAASLPTILELYVVCLYYFEARWFIAAFSALSPGAFAALSSLSPFFIDNSWKYG